MHIVLTRGVPKGIGWGGGLKGKGQRGQYPQPVAFWAGTSERLGCTGRRLCVCSSIWGQRRKELVVRESQWSSRQAQVDLQEQWALGKGL